ncbi:MAG: hypothetical protein ABIH66_04640 [bacterium]
MAKRKVRIPAPEEIEGGPVETILMRDTDMLWRIIGPMVRLAGKTSAGRFVMEQTGKLAGTVLAKREMFGMEKAEEPADVVSEWLKVLEGLGCEYEVGKVGKDEVEVFILDCPAGLSEKDGRETCDSGMSADRELVRRLGGELVIGETIATGAEKCHLKVVRSS